RGRAPPCAAGVSGRPGGRPSLPGDPAGPGRQPAQVAGRWYPAGPTPRPAPAGAGCGGARRGPRPVHRAPRRETGAHPARRAGPAVHLLSGVFSRAFAVRPEDRYGSAGELIEAARVALAGEAGPASDAETDPTGRVSPARTRRLSRRHRWVVVTALALVTVLA